MSTIQKAFIFIVVVLAVLTAAVNLVLFAQRSNWREMYTKQGDTLKAAQADLTAAKKELQTTKDADTAKAAELENKVGALTTQLESTTKDLDLLRGDKSRMETLASELKANYDILSTNMEALAQRTKELQTAKEAAEAQLTEVKAAAQTAEETLAISERKATDLAAQVKGLGDQLAERDNQIKLLQQKVDVLLTYAPPVGPSVAPASKQPVHGKVTGFTKDGSTVFISVGTDDGVVEQMLLLIYKSGGNFVAFAKVYDAAADKSAARIVQPVYGTIAEGDNVTNK